ncbi:Protein kinase, putative [Hondaea fermentalgiana]|uniref:Protein kinase, putative n=1 Tax=Hondaea fermentalgiana TaxID=2315210 RepID=A0A2R5GUT5_9STRA|nr:Protein kinase, putative [Hondaea fermentalgiana]|eukprot:GBG34622.1 Protein kinase, putative [Hondaea fermentalgiana]
MQEEDTVETAAEAHEEEAREGGRADTMDEEDDDGNITDDQEEEEEDDDEQQADEEEEDEDEEEDEEEEAKDTVAASPEKSAKRGQASPATAHPPSPQSDKDKTKRYRVVKKLGQGAYSKVYLAEMTDGGDKVAIKAVAKSRLKEKELASILRETEILASLRHPNVITYIEHFEDAEKLYIVTEFAEGGELFERVVEREFYAEADVRTIMIKLLKTVAFCHERGVVHRDIKPENILLASKEDDAEIRLADFGFAKQIEEDSFTNLQTACGTPGYVAPEVISRKPYDASCDVWSLGVVAYILLCGYPPFRGTDRRALFHKIRNADYEFDSPWWDPVSDDAKNFVARMLVADPGSRAKIPDLLKDPFLVSEEHVDISASLAPMREWNAKRKVALLRNTWQAMLRFKVFGGSARKSLSAGSLKEVESSGETPKVADLAAPGDTKEDQPQTDEMQDARESPAKDAAPEKLAPETGAKGTSLLTSDENQNDTQESASEQATTSLRVV